jgi:hypothetical protein
MRVSQILAGRQSKERGGKPQHAKKSKAQLAGGANAIL